MVTIEFTRNGQAGSKKVHGFALESTLRNFRAAGYTITSDGSAPAPVATPAQAELTGRVGKGLAVHRIIGNGAHCGTSYRRGVQKNLAVKVTGEPIDCVRCLGH